MRSSSLSLVGHQGGAAEQVFLVADPVLLKSSGFVIPAKAGIQCACCCGKSGLGPRLRGGDDHGGLRTLLRLPVLAARRLRSANAIKQASFYFLRRLAMCFGLGAIPALALASAAEPGLRIDTAHSFAGFSVRAAWVKRIDGRFAHIEGVVRPDVQERYVLEVRVASGSVLMGRESHEEWARSADFFDTDRHPWIEFRAAGLGSELLRAGGAIEGVLTLRGISRPVSFELLPADCAKPGLDCPVQARGEVDRSEFGMTARRVFVSDRVKLSFDIRLHPAPAARPDLG